MPTTERGTHHIFPKPFVEFIGLIGSSIHDSIIFEWKNSKYVTVSLDSTPDIANVDQLILIVRYVLPAGPEDLLNFWIWIVIMLNICRINCWRF